MLLRLEAVSVQTIALIAVIPVIMVGLALFAMKEPLLAMIIASLIFVGSWAYAIIVSGGMAAIMGWLINAIIVYLLFAGFQNAREAMKIKKELKL